MSSLLFLLLLLLGLGGLCHVSFAQDFGGTYHIASPSGPLRVHLQHGKEGVSGQLIGFDGTVYGMHGQLASTTDGGVAVEGVMASKVGSAQFVFAGLGEDGAYVLSIIPHDGFGTPQPGQTIVYVAHRGEKAPTVNTQPPTEPNAALHDLRLVGEWATQVIINAPEGSIATQFTMTFRADGVLVEGASRTMGFGGEAGAGGGETAAWRTQDGVLVVSYVGSPWTPLAWYEVTDGKLLLTYLQDGSRQLWYRQ